VQLPKLLSKDYPYGTFSSPEQCTPYFSFNAFASLTRFDASIMTFVAKASWLVAKN
jgi:hypothetical protein